MPTPEIFDAIRAWINDGETLLDIAIRAEDIGLTLSERQGAIQEIQHHIVSDQVLVMSAINKFAAEVSMVTISWRIRLASCVVEESWI